MTRRLCTVCGVGALKRTAAVMLLLLLLPPLLTLLLPSFSGFFFFFPPSPSPPDCRPVAGADILTPPPLPRAHRRSAQPRRVRHTYSIGPETDFIPYRTAPPIAATAAGACRACIHLCARRARSTFAYPRLRTRLSPRLQRYIDGDHRIPLERRRCPPPTRFQFYAARVTTGQSGIITVHCV